MIGALKKKLRNGFTLVEVLVATFIVVTSLVGLLSSYIAARHSASVARHQAQAINVLQEKMEELKSLGYDELLERSQTEPYQYDYSYSLDADNQNEEGVACYIVSYVSEDPDDTGCLDMWVNIGWPERTLGHTIWSWEWTMSKVAQIGAL